MLPIVHKLINSKPENPIHTVILAPTRELSTQINNVATNVLSHLTEETSKPSIFCTNVNKNSVAKDLEAIQKGANILISTPGRLADLIEKSGGVNQSLLRKSLKNIDHLIIDEADRVLSDNFKIHIDTILAALAKQRRTYLFSATLEKEIDHLMPILSRAGLRDPVKIVVKETYQQQKEQAENEEKETEESKNDEGKKEISDDKLPVLLNAFYMEIEDVSKKFDYLMEFVFENDTKIFFYCVTRL